MSDLDESFAKLLGRQPSDKERQELYRVRDALELKGNDALWLVLMALQHYQNQYEQVPVRIEDAARQTLSAFRETAEATALAAAASAKKELAAAVAAAARDVARHVEAAERLKWVARTIVVCVVCVGGLSWWMYAKGEGTGRGLGYAAGYEEAKDEKAAASWAATPEGKLAYGLAEVESIADLARCNRPGWRKDKDGKFDVCYPTCGRDGVSTGWYLPR